MKKSITLVFCLLFVVTVFAAETDNNKNSSEKPMATTTLKGKVLDKITGEPLTGVKISINNTKDVTYTDFDGTCDFKNMVPGKIELTASYISYKEKTEEVNLELTKNYSLEVKIEN